MTMDITKRFKIAVKQVCESLGLYPGGGSAKGKFQLTIINNSDENDAELDTGSTCYRISDGGDIIHESNSFYIEPGMTETFNLCVLAEEEYKSDDGGDDDDPVGPAPKSNGAKAINDGEDEDPGNIILDPEPIYSGDCTYNYYLCLDDFLVVSNAEIEINSTENLEEDNNSIDDGGIIDTRGLTREADAPSMPIYKITDPTKSAAISVTVSDSDSGK